MRKEINYIEKSILNAQLGNSKLTGELLYYPGQSSFKIKHLLNNIMEMPDINYLEIGTLWGSTFISSLYQNKLNSAYAIDINFTKEFKSITKKLNLELTSIESNCWKVDLSLIKHKINVYLYDGEHNYDDQYKALEYYYPVLDDTFIFMVDDWTMNSEMPIEKATRDSIKKLNLKILHERAFYSTGNDLHEWWNGFYVSILEKQK
jgi:hypothetical protein